ncbi:hypothetical protein FRC11_008567, partial [Ceratobasidium sp. 423]
FAFVASNPTCKCTTCGNEAKSWFYRSQPPRLANTGDTLENRLNRWVDGGCKPE